MRTLSIPYLVPSRNKLDAMHWAPRAANAKLVRRLLGSAALSTGGIPGSGPGRPMRVTILSLRARMLDADNLSGGCKSLLDALVHLRFLDGDRPQHVQVEYRQEKAPPELRGTTITIEPETP
jgi:hypothetical protein